MLGAIIVPLIVVNVVALAVLWPRGKEKGTTLAAPAGNPGLIAAKVVDRSVAPCTFEFDQDTGVSDCDVITVKLSSGPEKNTESSFQMSPLAGIGLRVGNRIYVERLELQAAGGTTRVVYSFYEFRRERPLLLLLLLFVVVAVGIGRVRGVRALLALAISMLMLAKFMLPAILEGRSPLLVALVGASAVMFVALYVSHGVSARTTAAVAGTLVSLAITGLLAAMSVSAARFTGLAGEEASYVRASAGQVDIRGLLLAGIIIGALGVLDDVTVTQASAVWELHRANPLLGFWETFRSALRIGRDHIASVVNTLVLAYAGAALPLLLLFTQAGTPIGEVLNGEPVATEIVRMLAGSIGLMAAVPITTALTALVVSVDSPPRVRGRPWRRPRTRQDRDWQPPRKEREFFEGG